MKHSDIPMNCEDKKRQKLLRGSEEKLTEQEERTCQGLGLCLFFALVLFGVFLTLTLGPKNFGW